MSRTRQARAKVRKIARYRAMGKTLRGDAGGRLADTSLSPEYTGPTGLGGRAAATYEYPR